LQKAEKANANGAAHAANCPLSAGFSKPMKTALAHAVSGVSGPSTAANIHARWANILQKIPVVFILKKARPKK